MKPLTQAILTCRAHGMTYREIVEKLKCSPSTVSYVCQKHDPGHAALVEANTQRKYANGKNISGARAGWAAAQKMYAENRSTAVAQWTQKLNEYPDQAFVSYIAGLYDGEGDHSGQKFSLCNSDPDLIRLFITFVVGVCAREHTATLMLHTSHDRDACLDFWRTQGVEMQYVYQYDKRPQKKDNRSRENHGTCDIRVHRPLGLSEALRSYRPSYPPAFTACSNNPSACRAPST